MWTPRWTYVFRCLAFIVATVLLGTPAFASEARNYANIVRHSDLVVHGIVTDISRDEVPATNLFHADPRTDATITILILRLKLQEVLKGYHSTPDLTLVVPQGISSIRTDYNVGNEVILSAIYWQYMKGGAYMVTNDTGCFRNWKGRWFCQNIQSDDETEVPMDSIRAAIDRSRPEVVAESAAIVAIATIEKNSSRRPPTENTASAWGDRMITATLTNVLTGPSETDVVQFRTMRRMGDNSPQFTPGEQWLIYLGRDDDAYFLLDATNGAFRVEGDSLIQANRVVVPDTRDAFVARLKEALRRPR